MNTDEIRNNWKLHLDGKLPADEVQALMQALSLPENRLLAEQLVEEGYNREEQSYNLSAEQESRILGVYEKKGIHHAKLIAEPK